MSPRGCWILAGLAMFAGSAMIAWWANFSMVSHDMGAPFVVGWMGACTCLPLGFVCFLIASFVAGQPPKVPEENRQRSELAPDFRWKTHEDEERQGGNDRD
jgi:hypothetical protein